jgi:hypothetical protein
MPNEISAFLTQAGQQRYAGKLILSYMIIDNGQVRGRKMYETWV